MMQIALVRCTLKLTLALSNGRELYNVAICFEKRSLEINSSLQVKVAVCLKMNLSFTFLQARDTEGMLLSKHLL